MIEFVEAYNRDMNPIKTRIEAYNCFLDKIKKIIGEIKEITSPSAPPGTYIKICDVHFEPPTVVETDSSRLPITPREAKLRKKTYSLSLIVDMKLYIDNVLRENKPIRIGEIPLMVKSKYCYLSKKPNETQEEYEERLMKLGYDPLEEGGYFIINGNEKTMVCFDERAPNKLIIKKDMKGNKSVIDARIFSISSDNIVDGSKTRSTNIFLRYTDGRLVFENSVLNKPVNIVSLLIALGMSKEEILKNMQFEETKLDLLINFELVSNVNTEKEALIDVGKRATTSPKEDVRISWAERIIDNYFLPHIGYKKEDRIKKAHFILKTIEKMCLVARSKLKEDDVDHFGNKRIKEANILMEELFRAAINTFIKTTRQHLDRALARARSKEKITLYKVIKQDVITEKTLNHMATGMWPTGYTGVLGNIDRYSYYNYIKSMTKVKSRLASSSGRVLSARDLHPTYLGKIDPIHFIEGKNAGFDKFAAFGLYCTKEINENLEEKIRDLGIEFI